jgi:hypothetical protein
VLNREFNFVSVMREGNLDLREQDTAGSLGSF